MRSWVTYCCQVWQPYLIRDIKALERLQRRASKYVINDYHLDYKSRLKSLNLPLSLWMELQDILFFLSLLKNLPDNFDICEYVLFPISPTCSSAVGKIKPLLPGIPRVNSTRHHFFNHTIKIWNSLPPR